MNEEIETEATEESSENMQSFESSQDNSLRDALEKGFEELETQEPETTTQPTAGERARDESGKFTKQSVKKEATQAGAAENAASKTTQATTSSQVAAPASMSPDKKDLFVTLPPEMQEYIAQRERDTFRDYQRKTEALAIERRKHQDIDEAVSPYEQQWALNGISTGQAVKQLIAAQNYIEQNPREGIKWLMDQYGLSAQDMEGQQSPIDPNLQRVMQEHQKLQTAYQQQQQQLASWQQQQIQGSLQSEIDRFATEKDATGNLTRPHFNSVVDDMIPLVQQIRATNPEMPHSEVLKAAYDKAVWLNPTTRDALIKNQSVQAAGKKLEEAKSRAFQVKRQSNGVMGAPNGSVAKQLPTDLRAALEATWDDIYQQ